MKEVDDMFRSTFGENSVKDLGDGVRAVKIDGSNIPGGEVGELIKKLLHPSGAVDVLDELQNISRDQVTNAFEAFAIAIEMMALSAKLRFEIGSVDNPSDGLECKLRAAQTMLQSKKEVKAVVEQVLTKNLIDDRLDLMVERRYAVGQAKPMLSMLVTQDLLNHLTSVVDSAIDQIEQDRTSLVDPDSDNIYAQPFHKEG